LPQLLKISEYRGKWVLVWGSGKLHPNENGELRTCYSPDAEMHECQSNEILKPVIFKAAYGLSEPPQWSKENS